MLIVYDSERAQVWVEENYDHELLINLRQAGISGPLPSILSINSAALSIFGPLNILPLVQIAEELAELSGFPVIIRPLKDAPFYGRYGHS